MSDGGCASLEHENLLLTEPKMTRSSVVAVCICLVACGPAADVLDEAEVMETDRAFARATAARGIVAAGARRLLRPRPARGGLQTLHQEHESLFNLVGNLYVLGGCVEAFELLERRSMEVGILIEIMK